MNRAELIGQRMSPLTNIMATNGLVELCGALEPGYAYDKAKCIFGRYENLCGAEMNKVRCSYGQLFYY